MITMTDSIFKLILTLMMCDDPSNLTPTELGDLEEWADEEAQSRGYPNWIDAYHKL